MQSQKTRQLRDTDLIQIQGTFGGIQGTFRGIQGTFGIGLMLEVNEHGQKKANSFSVSE
jgi:hypothetical protein